MVSDYVEVINPNKDIWSGRNFHVTSNPSKEFNLPNITALNCGFSFNKRFKQNGVHTHRYTYAQTHTNSHTL